MSRVTTRAIAALFAAGFVVAAQDVAAANYILRAPAIAIANVAARHGLTVVRTLDGQNPDVCLVSISDTRSDAELKAELRADPEVIGFEPDLPVMLGEGLRGFPLSQQQQQMAQLAVDRSIVNYFGASVWLGYAAQPAAVRIGVPLALARFFRGSAIVAVIDGPVDGTHPAIAGAVMPGLNFAETPPGLPGSLAPSIVSILDGAAVSILDGGTPTLDAGAATLGHGTMVAGLIHLVAPQARILPLTAFRADGSASLFDVVRAIHYAVEHGAKVINMSFSMTTMAPELMRAVNVASSRGVVCVASVGNAGVEVLTYPASFRSVLGVAATDALDARSPFSNYGESLVSIAAPGEVLIVPYPGNRYAVAWGTSFSAAIVSGAAAVLVGLDPIIKPENATLYFTTTAAPVTTVRESLGAGRLDLIRALLKWASSQP